MMMMIMANARPVNDGGDDDDVDQHDSPQAPEHCTTSPVSLGPKVIFRFHDFFIDQIFFNCSHFGTEGNIHIPRCVV